MKYAIAGLIAVLLAGVFVFAAVPVSSFEKAVGLNSSPEKKDHAMDSDDDDVDEDDENETGLAGGRMI